MHTLLHTLPIITVVPHKHQRVHHKMCVKQHVKDEFRDTSKPNKVVHGMWKTKHQVANEHGYHGPRGLVQSAGRARPRFTDGQTLSVTSHL